MRTLPILFYTWDIPKLNGQDLRKKPLTERKAILKEFYVNLPNSSSLKLTPYVEKGAVGLFLTEPEGIVAKEKDSEYVEMDEDSSSSNREKLWLKIKHTFIVIRDIAGYSLEAEGRLTGKLRNLVMLDNGVFCGTVGGGFSDNERIKVKAFLDQYPDQSAPISLTTKLKHQFVYKPSNQLKVRVAYQELTPANILYQPRMIELIYPQIVQLQQNQKPKFGEQPLWCPY
jgi:ATP-dependent DNA ligase